MFRGLFVGIDRYDSTQIGWLSCARSDATALRALCIDSLAGQADLLVDGHATKSAIETALSNLAQASPDDDVVIAFSGHGSETHQLVCFDSDPADLDGTAISLDQLGKMFAEIPAKRIVLFLDCCFSGGLGAKVLHVDTKPRDIASIEARLNALAGEGRLIVTASGAREPAYEDQRLGHGFFTYYLLQALQGAEEVREGGRIGLYRLLEFVTRNVTNAAARYGKPQNPTVKGNISRELFWPVFQPGTHYRAAFPERVQATATSEVSSLTAFGFAPEIVNAWAGAIPSLNLLQLSAINDFNVLTGANLVVSAPTSSGKTMVGELAALKSVMDHKRALFLLPLKALVNDKKHQFDSLYASFGIRTFEATGETDDIGPLLRGRYDIALLTYEKFAAIAIGFPHVLDQVGTIVVDEVQMIADEGRGANLEFVLTLLRMRQRTGYAPQLVALSAVIGNTNGFERWLDARLLRRHERPVPLDEGLLLRDGRFRYVHAETGEEQYSEPIIRPRITKGSSQDWVIPLVQKLVGEGKQVIVFREQKGETRGCANYLAQSLGLPAAVEAIKSLPLGDPSQASAELHAALQGGVAFHNADLDRDERRVIEEAFRAPNATLRVIAATTTLAMGINTPASAVVVVGLEHPGAKPYSIAEYKNLVGRAGRLGYSERGESYLVALDGRKEAHFWDRYVTGVPEDLVSRFLANGTDVRTLILRVFIAVRPAIDVGLPSTSVIDFLECSFGAFQEQIRNVNWQWSRDNIARNLQNLLEHGLLEGLPNGNHGLTSLGRLAGEGLCEVESIIRLVDALRPLQIEHITDPVLIALCQITVELSNVYFPINKKSTQKEPQAWFGELRNQGLNDSILRNLYRGVAEDSDAVSRAKKAVACLLYISNRSMGDIERIVTQFGGAFNGAAGPVRGVTSRTCDVLTTAARIAQILHPSLDLTSRVARLIMRLEYGISGAAVDLARHVDVRLTRADYQRLAAANVVSADAIDNASDEGIMQYIGGDKAKLEAIRRAPASMRKRAARAQQTGAPILEPFQA